MPLVRIAVRRGKDATYRQEIGRIVSKALAVGLRREDVFINLIEVKKENWSFGNGNRSACFGARYHGGKTLRARHSRLRLFQHPGAGRRDFC